MTDGWAVVTGASSGIGEQFALELGRRGYPVLLTGRSRERLDAVADRIRAARNGADPARTEPPANEAARAQSPENEGAARATSLPEGAARSGSEGGRAGSSANEGAVRAAGLPEGAARSGSGVGGVEVLVADLATDAGTGAVAAAIAARPVSLLVANAGAGGSGTLAELDAGTITRTVAVNLTAVARLAGAALPDMIARGSGGILLVSSAVAGAPAPGVPVYAATKAAVESLARSLRADVGPRGVRVTCVRPGWIRTPWHEHNATGGEDVEERFWRQPADVVTAALDAHDRDVETIEVPEPGLREKLYPYLVKLRGR